MKEISIFFPILTFLIAGCKNEKSHNASESSAIEISNNGIRLSGLHPQPKWESLKDFRAAIGNSKKINEVMVSEEIRSSSFLGYLNFIAERGGASVVVFTPKKDFKFHVNFALSDNNSINWEHAIKNYASSSQGNDESAKKSWVEVKLVDGEIVFEGKFIKINDLMKLLKREDMKYRDKVFFAQVDQTIKEWHIKMFSEIEKIGFRVVMLFPESEMKPR